MELALVSLNAEDHSATLRVQLTTPIYPIEVYHKPMTVLVWLGTALMTLSGLASAFYRRAPVPVEADDLAPVAPRQRTSQDLRPETIGGTQ
jgi:cytochrome c biogenesis factor